MCCFFFCMQQQHYVVRISDLSSDVCSSDLLIADAYINGVRGFDAEPLYDAMIKTATTSEGRPKDKKGRVVGAVGREGVEYYNQLGYVPYDVGINENAARTLEYATADFSISQMATRSEEPTSELQSLMRNPYAGFCLKKKK